MQKIAQTRWSLPDARIGLIGLGNVGASIARNILGSNYTLSGVLDANPTATDFLPQKITRHKYPARLAEESDVIITALGVPGDVKNVMEGDNGIFKGIQKDSVWIDHSTTDYNQTIKFAQKVNEKGSKALEAPVTGGMALLKQGLMTCLVGGNSTTFKTYEPLLRLSCKNVLYMGEMGSATITKVVSNMLAAAHNVLMGEALMIAKRSDVDLKAFFDGIRLSAGNSFVIETEAPLVFNGTYQPDFSLKLHCKDLNLGSEISKKYGVPIPVHALVEQIYNQARLKYGDEAGSSHPPKLSEDLLGVSLQEKGFEDWTYTIEQVTGGSIGVVHKKKEK